MKKIVLMIAAMFAMAQLSAATNDAAINSEANPETATAVAAADDDSEKTYQHPFTNDDESTKHWTIITGGFYTGLGVKHSWDLINNSFEIGLLNIVAVNYNSLHGQNISLGVGIQHRSYSIKRPHMLVRDDNSVVTVGEYPSLNIEQIKNRTSNLNLWTFQVPLVFKQRIVKKLELSLAGILDWNTYARVDNAYEMDKTDHEIRYKDLKQNKLNFDVMGSLAWNDLGIYCRYSPGKFFKDGHGPEIKNTWTVGVIVAL